MNLVINPQCQLDRGDRRNELDKDMDSVKQELRSYGTKCRIILRPYTDWRF